MARTWATRAPNCFARPWATWTRAAGPRTISTPSPPSASPAPRLRRTAWHVRASGLAGPGHSWHVLDAAREALESLAPDKAAEAQAEALEAREAFREAKAEAREAAAQGAQGARLCAMVRDALGEAAREALEAGRRARAWAAFAADLGEGARA